jgi:S-DNA-T family DNA segregation ATPase FtsK/SpoIIIE
MLSLILCRINPEYLCVAGGQLSARVVLAAEGFVGGIVSWIGLFSLFMISVVVFTGWDIAEDINSILGRCKNRKKTAVSQRRVPELSEDTGENLSGAENPWVQHTDAEISVSGIRPAPTTAEASEVEDYPVKTGGTVKPPVDINEPVKTVSNTRKQAKPRSTHDTGDQYSLPAADFLSLPADGERHGQTQAEIDDRAALLVGKLSDFGVECTIADSCPGPVLTRYELTPGVGVKVNRILNLSDDLALALAAKRIRILAPIPGKGAVGIEVPNKNPETVYLREIITRFRNERIPVALGKRLEGQPFIVDLTDMPHLLIAGATGSGKSVCVHAIISTILLTRSPYQVKLAMIDPKMLELSAYKGIPHLWAPVVVQTSKARYLLEALVKEMEERYALLARTGVRSIAEYNRRFGPDQPEEYLPYIVVVIDELADLMMVSSRDVEPAIARLAQMARAVGIHLVIATQRPSVDVITGVIKANFPSRIAFNVGSKTDSRTILDMNGAEKLLGKGDMLFIPAASPEPVRVHGSFISTEETRALVDFWREQPEMPFEYEPPDDEHGNLYDPGVLDFDDPILEEVKRVVVAQQRASVSMIQRKFRVGYARAGKLIDMLEQLGVVGPHLGSKPRDVLVKPELEEETDE